MKPRPVPLVIAALVLAGLVAGCAPEELAPPARAAAATVSASDTIDFDGVRDVRIGETDAQLTADGDLTRPKEACGPVLTEISQASPVMADGRLVLLWADPPLATPEGVGVGTPLATAKAAYPQATTLTAPAGTYRFDGLMVTHGDRAYLFLHDGQTVRKTVVGYTDHAQRLFTDGFGAC